MIDYGIGLKQNISTNYMREKYMKTHFQFLEPHRKIIKDKEAIVKSFFYYTPVQESLERLLKDNSLRKYIINYPTFPSNNVSILDYLICVFLKEKYCPVLPYSIVVNSTMTALCVCLFWENVGLFHTVRLKFRFSDTKFEKIFHLKFDVTE